MGTVKDQVLEILENLESFLDEHDSMAELVEVKGDKVVIQLIGTCAECDDNCLGDAIYEKMPLVEVVFQAHANR